eukprot:g6639.t1
MSSKWALDDDDGKDEGGNGSPLTPNSPPSEQKEAGGRRSRRPRPGREGAATADSSPGGVDRPPVKTVAGGWGLDAAGPVNSEAQSKSETRMMETQQKLNIESGGNRGIRRNHFDNEETEILVIPDLEDEGEEDIVLKVAAAPKNTTRRVPSLRELDEDLKHAIPSSADGLDMSLLTKTLVPPEMLEEDDSPWDFDTLLQSVTQEFNAEKRMALDPTGKAGSDPSSIALDGGSGSQMQSGHRSSRALVA